MNNSLQEVMMIPSEDWRRLQEYYKGSITQNSLLEKAGRLGAEEHVILADKNISDSLAVAMIKPLASERAKLTKQLRTATGPVEEPETMVHAPNEALVRKLLTPKVEKTTPLQTPGPARRLLPSIPPVSTKSRSKIPVSTKYGKTLKPLKKPTPPSKPKKKSGLKDAAIKGAAKGVAKSFGLNINDTSDESDNSDSYVEEEGSHRKKKGATRPKRAKTAAEKLNINKPAKRGKLNYGSDPGASRWEDW